MSRAATLDQIAAALGAFGAAWQIDAPAGGVLRVHGAAGDVLLADAPVWRDQARFAALADESRTGRAYLVCLAPDDDFAAALAGSRDLDLSCLPLPVHAARLELGVREAFDSLHQRRIVETARLLASERDVDKLLRLILEACRAITGADAGSLYVVEGEGEERRLRFKVAQNDSRPLDLADRTIDVDSDSIVGRCVVTGRTINLPDARDPRSEFRYDPSVDERIGYRTRSILAVPLRSARGDVIGVAQIINKKRRPGARLDAPADFADLVVTFGPDDERLVDALAGQAGVSLENAQLYGEIRGIFDGFVRASVEAIEMRDPTTSGHSLRVANLTVGLAVATDREDRGPYGRLRFTTEELKRIEWAAVLHDFGKVGVPEAVLVKAKKLHDPQMELLRQRFAMARMALEVERLRGRLARADFDAGVAALGDDLALVERANQPTVLEEAASARLRDLGERRFRDVDGREWPLLTGDDLAALSVRRGSLTGAERRAIESHVVHTRAFLEKIPWGREFRGIPEIAGAHHEKLDGTGYPRGLGADSLPPPVRMMTICDIFDALVASDRPYKKALPAPRALDILSDEARQGKLDADLLRIFVEADVWRRTAAS